MAATLSAELGLSSLAARLLVLRGQSTPQTATQFLSAGVEGLHDPYLLLGMEAAVKRIRLAVEHDEKVLVYGDYDADGVSSTSLMLHLFRELRLRHDYYIPHRMKEGYGMNIAAVEQAAADGFSLIVTVDNGISAVEQIAHARSLGLSVVVTDHHEPPDILPEADAIVNPKQRGCPYPFKGLAGAGVAFKLAQALLGRAPLEWSDIAALGTIADLMPLTDENRILVRCGLQTMQRATRPGFQALAEVSGTAIETVSASDIGFQMGPRINAAGRLEHAGTAVQLLISEDVMEAARLATGLDQLNIQRRAVVEEITKAAEAAWEERCRRANAAGEPHPGVIVLAGAGWNPGVIGIVASKLLERHYRPAVLLGLDESTGLCKGSARSIPGYDLYEALRTCSHLMEHYGGHAAAAGMTLKHEHLEALEQGLCVEAARQLKPEDYVAVSKIDLVCSPAEATLQTIQELSRLEPFGSGNPVPKVLVQASQLAELRTIGKGNTHLKLTLGGRGDSSSLDAIGFGLGELAEGLSGSSSADVVGELSVNEWNGKRRAQLMIRDLRVSEPRVYDMRGNRDPIAMLLRLQERLLKEGSSVAVVGSERALPPQLHQQSAAAGSSGMKGSVIQVYHPAHLPADGFSCRELVLLEHPASWTDLQHSIEQSPEIAALHLLFRRNRSDEQIDWIERKRMVDLYGWLKRLSPLPGTSTEAAKRLSAQAGCPPDAALLALNVFAELDFIRLDTEGWTVNSTPAKRDLSESTSYKKAIQEQELAVLLHGESDPIRHWLGQFPGRQHVIA
ncbi:single-stranded-DNA-specific exonuclease RecJ [Paenibacillus herberti]|uniref:Single-stranded-DNA-specific exonuclease RecJ n=1 Tax=Paenibacillus herberti TaxID=1619309 RepID=A0A229P072_9BACL|nr:single-stranded-DNA-specific exonuclease RecJ [Paenibacillus herberti]OXM15394.1 single-stranded-DNA-specific exonuclease RecJ [Paenibacillus herberti]